MSCLATRTVCHDGVYHEVPCGKCGFCLQSKRSSWMFRVFYEMRYQEKPGYFLTLTYDEKHVKRVGDGLLSLRFRDVQLYLKRIRKAKYYAKYICVGEYGSVTNRPHYHLLLWTDAPPTFLQAQWKSSKDGSILGNIKFGTLNMSSAMYTLKYIIQPKHKFSRADPRENTRAQFSKGLGLMYLGRDFKSGLAMMEYHTQGDGVFTGMVDGHEVALPRYYREKLFLKHQKVSNRLKVKESLEEKKRIELERVTAIGVKDAEAYLHAIRVEKARRIISKTKFTEKL